MRQAAQVTVFATAGATLVHHGAVVRAERLTTRRSIGTGGT